MKFTHFTLTQNGEEIGAAAVMEQAINAAKGYATSKNAPVSVVGHRDDGEEKEVIYHPDGRIEKIWKLAKSTPFYPAAGRTYRNAGGGTYLCKSADGTEAIMVNIKSKWSLVAHGCRIYFDGSIEWDYSTNGCFEN